MVNGRIRKRGGKGIGMEEERGRESRGERKNGGDGGGDREGRSRA